MGGWSTLGRASLDWALSWSHHRLSVNPASRVHTVYRDAEWIYNGPRHEPGNERSVPAAPIGTGGATRGPSSVVHVQPESPAPLPASHPHHGREPCFAQESADRRVQRFAGARCPDPPTGRRPSVCRAMIAWCASTVPSLPPPTCIAMMRTDVQLHPV